MQRLLIGLDTTVAAISRTRVINAPPAAVWDVLDDFGSLSSWADNVDHSCVLQNGPDGPGVGTSRRVQVGRNTLVERIIEYTPRTTLGYAIDGLPPRLGRVTNHWTITPAGTGTAVTLTSAVQIGNNPLAALAERATCRFMSRQSDVMLAGLAARMEDRR